MKSTIARRAGVLVLAAAVPVWAMAQPAQMPIGEGQTSGQGMGHGTRGSGTMDCPMMGMMGQGMQGMMGQGMMGQGMMGPGMMGSGSMAAMAEGRLAYLRAELGITEAQAAAWKEYADAVKARASAMQGMHGQLADAMQGTAPDRMKARAKMMESMVAGVRAVTPALERLYAALTDEQKKKADQLLGMTMM